MTLRRIILTFTFLLCSLAAVAQASNPQYFWRATTGGRIRGRPAATRDGRVYVLSEDRHMYALDEERGAVLWRSYLGGRVWDSLCIGADGTIYTVLKDGDLLAINRSGGLVWRFKATGLPVGNPAAGPDGTVYFALDSGMVFAISHTGTERWRTRLPAPASSGPVIGVAGDLYVASTDRNVYALRSWGVIMWNALLAGVPGAPAISEDGLIAIGTDIGTIVALDPGGSILWDLVSKSPFLPPVIGREHIFAATAAGEIFALDFSGEVVWKTKAPEALTGPLAVTAGNDLLVLSARERLLKYRDDGVESGGLDVRGSGSLFTVSPSGKYLFARSDWLVYAYKGSLPLGEGWPQTGRDPAHTSSRMERTGSSNWLDQFRDDVEFVYLEHLVGDRSRESKLMAAAIMEDQILVNESIQPYLSVLLASLASEGTVRTELELGRVLNDFPEIRRAAAELLGQVGTLQSGDLLIRLLTYEYDSAVQRAMIRALGALMSDRTGMATAAISTAVLSDLRGGREPDSRMALEVLRSIAAIHKYNGEMPHELGHEALFEIYRGDYPKYVRERALEVMRSIGG
jgi:outer membrane protein assembly factor BamB